MNVLISTVTRDKFSEQDLEYVKKNLNFDKLYVVTGEWSEVEEYSSFDACICQHACRLGNYDEYFEEYINDYVALDEKILNEFAQYFPEIMSQMSRDEDPFKYQIDKTFGGRYRHAMRHLKFWYNFIIDKNIDTFMLLDSPHAGFDYLIYNLCKVLHVKTVCVICDMLHARRFFVARNLDEFESIFKNAESSVNAKLECGEALPLPEDLEAELKEMSSGSDENMQAVISGFSDTKIDLLLKEYYGFYSLSGYLDYIWHYSYDSYIKNYSRIKSVLKTIRVAVPSFIEGYKRANISYGREIYKKTLQFFNEYDEVAVEADYSCKYVYYAIQYIPENSSNPLGDRLYEDQTIPIGIISESIPEDWKIYVKIHPAQLGVVCTMDMMREIARIPKVSLVKRLTPTLELTRHSQAVSTLTGHVAWEAQFMNVPALVFGITDLRYAPMSYYVRTREQCKEAIENIINNPKTTNVDELRRFLLTHSEYTFFFNKEKIVEEAKKILDYEE